MTTKEQTDQITPLKAERLKRTWTTIEVAKAAGVDTSTYNRIERGAQQASAAMAEKIAKVFGGAVTEMQILYPSRFMIDRHVPTAKAEA